MEKLDRYWQKFENQHYKVIKYQSDPKFKDNAYFTEEVYDLAEGAFFANKAELVDMLEELNSSASSAANGCHTSRAESVSTSACPKKSLPKINLPTFSGRYQEWTPFRDMFTKMVGEDESLSAVVKLYYLKGSLTGEAAKLIAQIPVTDENFDRAWEKLVTRFENKRALVNAQLDTLFALKPVTRKSARDLEKLRATVSEVLEALDALGGRTEHWDFIIVYFVCHHLDIESHEAWELKQGDSTEYPTHRALDSFLETRARALESVDMRHPSQRFSAPVGRQPPRTPPARVCAATRAPRQTPKASCSCCTGPHYISMCNQYQAKSPDQRRQLVISKSLCLNCLGGYPVSDCISVKRCPICGENHHTTIHPRQDSGLPNTSATSSAPSSGSSNPVSASNRLQSSTSATSHHATRLNETPQTLLATAVVKTLSPQGHHLIVRALLDQGSELSFVCESLVQTLKLPRSNSNILLCGIGAQTSLSTRGLVTLRLQHRSSPEVNINVEAHIIPRITGKIPTGPVPLESCAQFSGLDLADPSFNVPGHVDILLGANIYAHLLNEEIRRTDLQAPVAQRTVFGWIISGPLPGSSSRIATSSQGYCCVPDRELHGLVKRFWEQEDVPAREESKMSTDDRACETHFGSTHSRDSDGRYTVRLPFKSVLTGQEE